MTSHDYEQANARLALISSRDAESRPVTQADIDSIMWAVQQLDNRNRELRKAMDEDADVTLTNEDVRGLENSVQNIRDLHHWVLRHHRPDSTVPSQEELQNQQYRQLNNTTNVKTTSQSSSSFQQPPPQGRQQDIRHETTTTQHQTLPPPQQRVAMYPATPATQQVSYIEPQEETLQMTAVSSSHIPPRHQGTGRRVQESSIVQQPSGGEVDTLRTVSADTGVSVNELRAANPQLEDLGANDPIPDHVDIRVPTQKSRLVTSPAKSAPASSRSARGGSRASVTRHRTTTTEVSDVDTDVSTVSSSSTRWRDRRRRLSTSRRRQAQEEVFPEKVVDGEVTLALLSQQCKMSIEEILHQNPNLEQYGTHEVIPFSESIEVRRRVVDEDDAPRPPSGSSRRTQTTRTTTTTSHPPKADTADQVFTVRGDTLFDIAQHLARCPVDEIRDLNPDLEEYGTRDILPTGTPVWIPNDYSSGLEKIREFEETHHYRSNGRGRSSPVHRSSPTRAGPPPPRARSLERDFDEAEEEEDEEAFSAASEESVLEVGSSQVKGARTLGDIADVIRFPVAALRDANPGTLRFQDYEKLPSRMLLNVPPESARRYFSSRGRAPRGSSSPPVSSRESSRHSSVASRRGGRGGSPTRIETTTYRSETGSPGNSSRQVTTFKSRRAIEPGTEIYVTKAGDRLDRLAAKWQCEIDELVDNCPELDAYDDNEALPKGLTIILPETLPPSGDQVKPIPRPSTSSRYTQRTYHY